MLTPKIIETNRLSPHREVALPRDHRRERRRDRQPTIDVPDQKVAVKSTDIVNV